MIKTIHVFEADWDWLVNLKRVNRFKNVAVTISFVRRKLPKQYQT